MLTKSLLVWQLLCGAMLLRSLQSTIIYQREQYLEKNLLPSTYGFDSRFSLNCSRLNCVSYFLICFLLVFILHVPISFSSSHTCRALDHTES
jgi:hypothetical protein